VNKNKNEWFYQKACRVSAGRLSIYKSTEIFYNSILAIENHVSSQIQSPISNREVIT
jgi:hypothetical protein